MALSLLVFILYLLYINSFLITVELNHNPFVEPFPYTEDSFPIASALSMSDAC